MRGERDPALAGRKAGLVQLGLGILEERGPLQDANTDQTDGEAAVWLQRIDQNHLAVARPGRNRRAAVVAQELRRAAAGRLVKVLEAADARLRVRCSGSIRAHSRPNLLLGACRGGGLPARRSLPRQGVVNSGS